MTLRVAARDDLCRAYIVKTSSARNLPSSWLAPRVGLLRPPRGLVTSASGTPAHSRAGDRPCTATEVGRHTRMVQKPALGDDLLWSDETPACRGGATVFAASNETCAPEPRQLSAGRMRRDAGSARVVGASVTSRWLIRRDPASAGAEFPIPPQTPACSVTQQQRCSPRVSPWRAPRCRRTGSRSLRGAEGTCVAVGGWGPVG